VALARLRHSKRLCNDVCLHHNAPSPLSLPPPEGMADFLATSTSEAPGASEDSLLPLLWGHSLLESPPSDHIWDVDLFFAPDGRALLLTAHQRSSVKLYDAEKGTLLATAHVPGPVATVKAVEMPHDPDGAGPRTWKVVAGGWHDRYHLYDLIIGDDPAVELELRPGVATRSAGTFWLSFSYTTADGHPRAVLTTQITNPGAVVIDGESGAEIRRGGLANWEAGCTLFHTGDLAPNSRLVLSTGEALMVCDPETGEQIASVPHGATKAMTAFPESRWEGEGARWLLASVTAGTGAGVEAPRAEDMVEIREVEPPTLALVRRIELQSHPARNSILSMAVIPWGGDMALAVASSQEHRVTVHDLETGETLGAPLESNTSATSAGKLALRVVKMPEDRKGLLFASYDGRVRLWALEEGGTALRPAHKLG
jgi:WD40 repeat protein